MPKTYRNRKLGDAAIAKTWKLAQQIDTTSQYVRYANKPSDLTLPITQLIQMSHTLQMLRDQWIEAGMRANKEDLDKWPKLWSRYL